MGLVSDLFDRWDKGIVAFRQVCRSVIYICVICYVALCVRRRSQSFLIVVSIIGLYILSAVIYKKNCFIVLLHDNLESILDC